MRPSIFDAIGRYVFPTRVRMWHFIVIPAAAMVLLITTNKVLDRCLTTRTPLIGSEPFQVLRMAATGLVMAAVIVWLAARHRLEYEAKLHRQNEDLRATKDYLSSVIEGAAEAIVTLDNRWRVASWNQAAEELYGWTAREMQGQTIDRLYTNDPEGEQERNRVTLEVGAGHALRHYEATRLRKDGRRIDVHITYTPLQDSEGRFSRVVS